MIVQIKIGHKKIVCIFRLEDGTDGRQGQTEPFVYFLLRQNNPKLWTVIRFFFVGHPLL